MLLDQESKEDIRPWNMDTNSFCMLMHLSQFASSVFPLAGIIEGFRSALIGGSAYGEMPYGLLLNGGITTLFLLITGLYFFRSKESIFADVA